MMIYSLTRPLTLVMPSAANQEASGRMKAGVFYGAEAGVAAVQQEEELLSGFCLVDVNEHHHLLSRCGRT